MSRAAHVKQADVTRYLKGAEKAGKHVSGFKIGPNGEFEAFFGGNRSEESNSFDELIIGKK
jgi:hypothetical protein